MSEKSSISKAEAYEQARREVNKIKDFYYHLGIYTLVNIFLLLIDVVPDGSWDWSYWVLFGWGIAIGLQAIELYTLGSSVFKDWEDKKVEEIVKRKVGK
ncbi:MAG: 2TM domain-containing protein [Patescibacteria group bacterium]